MQEAPEGASFLLLYYYFNKSLRNSNPKNWEIRYYFCPEVVVITSIILFKTVK